MLDDTSSLLQSGLVKADLGGWEVLMVHLAAKLAQVADYQAEVVDVADPEEHSGEAEVDLAKGVAEVAVGLASTEGSEGQESDLERP